MTMLSGILQSLSDKLELDTNTNTSRKVRAVSPILTLRKRSLILPIFHELTSRMPTIGVSCS